MNMDELDYARRIPPPVDLSAVARKTPESAREQQGYTVKAVYDFTYGASYSGEVGSTVLRFSTNSEDVFDAQARFLEVDFFADGGKGAAWRATDTPEWSPLQTSAGEEYSAAPGAGALAHDDVTPRFDGVNTLSVKVRGDQGEMQINGTPIGFLTHPDWLSFASVAAMPGTDGYAPSAHKFTEDAQQRRKLKTLTVERYIPWFTWTVFGISAGLTFGSMLLGAALE